MPNTSNPPIFPQSHHYLGVALVDIVNESN